MPRQQVERDDSDDSGDGDEGDDVVAITGLVTYRGADGRLRTKNEDGSRHLRSWYVSAPRNTGLKTPFPTVNGNEN